MRAPTLDDVERRAREAALDTLIDELRGRPDRLSHWLARALRVDLSTITKHPELTLQCAWARGHAVREPAEVAILRPLLDTWRTQHGRRPWARALRPPRHPPWGALREEYRGAFADARQVALRDGSIVVDGAQRTTIDRRTGRTTSEPIAGAPMRWELDRLREDATGRWRVLDRTSGATVVELQLDDDDHCGMAVATDDARRVLFVGGWCGDYEGVIACFDVASGTLRWRRDLPRSVGWVACNVDGRLAVASCGDHVVLIDGVTGVPRQQGAASGRAGALDDDGETLVTVDRHAVRVWDVAALRADQRSVPRGSDEGLVDAMWSPDGTRLLTGRALCDGQDGRPIRTLTMDTGGYLEGGPSISDIALGDQLLVELQCFDGPAMWDPRTGRRLPAPHRREESRIGARRWFAPNAELYVETSRWEKTPSVLLRSRDGRSLAALDPRLEAVTWSPDSRCFITHAERTRGYRLEGDTLVEVAPFEPQVASAPYTLSHRDGMLWLVPRDPGVPSYCLAEDEPLVADATGRRWASRFAHYALEG